MRTFDDHSLEFWGDVFQACRLAGEGVSFEDFIIGPQRVLQDFGMDDAVEILESGFLPLLPKQARVRARLEGLQRQTYLRPSGRSRLGPVQGFLKLCA